MRQVEPSLTLYLIAVFLISGWKSRYAFADGSQRVAGDGQGTVSGAKERRRKRCPLCRGIIPPTQEQISDMKYNRSLMEMHASDPFHPSYQQSARKVEQFEAEYGEDWEGSMIEYRKDFINLPAHVGGAVVANDVRVVLQWLNRGNMKERVNAKCEGGGNMGLLQLAGAARRHDLMSYLLLNGADVNILDSSGVSGLSAACTAICLEKRDYSKEIRMLLTWGAELYLDGKHITSRELKQALCDVLAQNGHAAIAQLISAELGGRRCEIVGAPDARGDLVGKTCVAEEYIAKSDRYRVTMEFTEESLLLGADDLRRRDRTPRDPGYYVERANGRLIRRDFKSNADCRAFIACLGACESEPAEACPDAAARAEQAAADLLAELDLEDSTGSKAPEKEKPTSIKKKKRRGKKKGRK